MRADRDGRRERRTHGGRKGGPISNPIFPPPQTPTQGLINGSRVIRNVHICSELFEVPFHVYRRSHLFPSLVSDVVHDSDARLSDTISQKLCDLRDCDWNASHAVLLRAFMRCLSAVHVCRRTEARINRLFGEERKMKWGKANQDQQYRAKSWQPRTTKE